jgi:uncharacterized cysteine cluster protein YcgN (CxxCxxCC family)
MLPEIDLNTILKSLRSGEEVRVLCEGCGLVCIRRNDDETIEYGYYKRSETVWVQQFDGIV